MLEERNNEEFLGDYFTRLYEDKKLSFSELVEEVDYREMQTNFFLNDEAVLRAEGKEYSEFMDYLFDEYSDELGDYFAEKGTDEELFPYVSKIAVEYKDRMWNDIVKEVENTLSDDFLDSLKFYGEQMLKDTDTIIGPDEMKVRGMYVVHCRPDGPIGMLSYIGYIDRRKTIEEALKFAIGTRAYVTFAMVRGDKRVVYGFVSDNGKFGILSKESMAAKLEMKQYHIGNSTQFEYAECEPYEFDNEEDEGDLETLRAFEPLRFS